MLAVRDVTVQRGGRRILGPITWQIREGERWVVLGPNGAGKTTLLDIAGARIHPTSGAAVVLDEPLGLVDVFDLRARIGVVSPRVAAQIPPGETVADAVVTAAWAVAGRWRESYSDDDMRRATATLAKMGMAALAGRTYGTLSDGERKRVLIARALMPDPEVLLLDEPAAGLDLGAREELVRYLAALAGSPAAPATVLVTHHVEEIPAGFTHALILADGAVVAAGPIRDVLTDGVLSRAFGLPLSVTRSAGRYWAFRAT